MLVVIAIAQLMVILDATIVNVALPSMQTSLGFSTENLSWVVNAYTLAFGGLLLLGGRVGDLLGRRPAFIGGILLFTLGSLLGGLAQNSGWLLGMRVVQGADAAIVVPTVLSLLATGFPTERERNRAFAVFAGVSGAGGAIGLTAGGLLTEWVSWRWVPAHAPPRRAATRTGRTPADAGSSRALTGSARMSESETDVGESAPTGPVQACVLPGGPAHSLPGRPSRPPPSFTLRMDFIRNADRSSVPPLTCGASLIPRARRPSVCRPGRPSPAARCGPRRGCAPGATTAPR